MATYTLTATKGALTETVLIEASNDTSATLNAITEIMERAYPNTAPWDTGEITLTDENGVVIRSMSEKGELTE